MEMKGVGGGERWMETIEFGHFNLKQKVESYPERVSVRISPPPPDSEASGSQARVTSELAYYL